MTHKELEYYLEGKKECGLSDHETIHFITKHFFGENYFTISTQNCNANVEILQDLIYKYPRPNKLDCIKKFFYELRGGKK